MGGLAVRDPDTVLSGNFISGHCTLTPHAVLFCARQGGFLDVSSETIQDRCKANLLGKSLVCLQVTWFVIQCIARAIAGYPLALLEVHTTVHVACALILYILWWEVSSLVLGLAAADTLKRSHRMFLSRSLLTFPSILMYSIPCLRILLAVRIG